MYLVSFKYVNTTIVYQLNIEYKGREGGREERTTEAPAYLGPPNKVEEVQPAGPTLRPLWVGAQDQALCSRLSLCDLGKWHPIPEPQP